MTFLDRNKIGNERRRPSTDAGERIYAIGDVHGRYDLLRRLFDRINRHAEGLPEPRSTHLILLGDVIDRGPDSARMIEFLQALQKQHSNMTVLLGNHEELMLAVLGAHPQAFGIWLDIGGDATLASYGVDPFAPGTQQRDIIANALAAIPPHHLAWMNELPLSAQSGDYFFCHAGIRPGVSLKRQSPADLLRIRDEFLTCTKDHGSVIVHGHSISTTVEMPGNRIGIDTGAYYTNNLTALYLEGEKQEVLTTMDDPR